MTRYVFLILLFASSSIISCRPSSEDQERSAQERPNSRELNDALIQQNRQLIAEEIELIDAYVDRNGLVMDTTSTGLRYKILEKTNGREVRLMKDITLSYSVSLLNGNLCYSSDSSGFLSFTIGQSNQPSGLQEGLLKMKEGELAIFIVPSYLGYGITGDGICIPGSSSILYHVKLEKVSIQ
ncbi:MAG: FKBP-type peptidyl-prolyl cis-trans isomerase [Bacteroidetes bacterium]|nr:FKBP-type peptidyl-prolyl cis-trans isomerase [Bacteroidota bacterium]